MGKKETLNLEKIRELVLSEKTGTPQELAEKVGLSRRMTYYYISRMKERGENIEYSRKRSSFYFVQEEEK